MPRNLIRYQQSGQFHFITFSCYRRMPLLNSSKAYSAFEHELERIRIRYGFVIAGYVLMPEHVHLLTNEPTVSSLAVVLQVLKQQTSRKLKSPETNQFWQRRYYDFNVYSEAKTIEKLKYMHRNPVRRGLVAKPEDWSPPSYAQFPSLRHRQSRHSRDRVGMDRSSTGIKSKTVRQRFVEAHPCCKKKHQGWGTQICGWDRKSRKQGTPPANQLHEFSVIVI
jgi:putative transposase